jgi:inorganic phosphate transporter, PiT family
MIGISFIVAIIGISLLFDLINGFHDAANSVATIVSTRVLPPFYAVLWASFFNFAAMFFFAPKVANTIAKIVKIEMNDVGYVYVVLSGLLAAILWDLLTWRLGLPTSSSHALIGGLSGAGVTYAGWEVLQWDMLKEALLFIVFAPFLGFFFGFIFMAALYWYCQNYKPAAIQSFFGKAQFISAALYSLGHGANDAQKTMGIIVALLVATGWFHPDIQLSLGNSKTLWIIVSCHLALALGTALGGWRIVKTLGMKIVKLKSIGGFSAEISGALTLFFATTLGIPVSTTHTITGAIVGVGTVSDRLSKIKWGIASHIILAWILTIPATALFAAGIFMLITNLTQK